VCSVVCAWCSVVYRALLLFYPSLFSSHLRLLLFSPPTLSSPLTNAYTTHRSTIYPHLSFTPLLSPLLLFTAPLLSPLLLSLMHRYSEVDSVDVDQQIQNDLDDELDGHERVRIQYDYDPFLFVVIIYDYFSVVFMIHFSTSLFPFSYLYLTLPYLIIPCVLDILSHHIISGTWQY
jgi:hypothetical protein